VGLDVRLEVQVAGRASGPPGVSRTGDPELHAVGDPGGDVDGDDLAAAHPAFAAALGTRRLEHLPAPVARRARARGHDRPEDAPLDLLELPGAVAPVATRRPRAGFRADAVAPLARFQGIDRHVALRSEGCLLERDRDLREGILTPAGAGARAAPLSAAAPAEEHVEDVPEREHVGDRLVSES